MSLRVSNLNNAAALHSASCECEVPGNIRHLLRSYHYQFAFRIVNEPLGKIGAAIVVLRELL